MRTVRDTQLDSATARLKLKVKGKPYWRLLDPGLHLGYRRLKGRSGTWVRRRYLGDEKYSTEGIGTADDNGHADGVHILSFKQAQEKARGRPTIKAGPFTVRQCLEEYLEWMSAERKSSHDARLKVEAFIIPALGDRKPEDLTTEDYNRWRNHLAAQPARARTGENAKQNYRQFDRSDDEAVRRRKATVNRVWTIFRAALNRAFKTKKIADDSEWRRVEQFKDVGKARAEYLEVADATRLINGCDADFRSLVQGALQSGCRFSELSRLTVSDFHKASGTIAIRQSKSGKSRNVVLTDEGVELFNRWTAGRAGGDLLFRHNGQPWKTTQKPMAEACKRARISPPVSFHTLRHTWASLAVMNGVPLIVVAKNLGHSDTRMVEKHYGHLGQDFVAEAIRNGAPRFGIPADNVKTIR